MDKYTKATFFPEGESGGDENIDCVQHAFFNGRIAAFFNGQQNSLTTVDLAENEDDLGLDGVVAVVGDGGAGRRLE